ILRVNLNWNGRKEIERITPAAINSLNAEERAFFTRALEGHSKGTWKRQKARDVLKYTLAVLVDTNETDSPSDRQSLKHFSKLAEKSSIDVEPIHKGDLHQFAEVAQF